MTAPILIDPASSQLVTLGFAAPATGVGTVTVQALGLVPGGASLTATSALSAGQVILTLGGGTNGERYDVSVRATLATSDMGERQIHVAAIVPDWTMPDGSAGWLTVTGFVERFGLDETIIATDRDGSRMIDSLYLIGALRDAQAEAEAFVAGRYALPLSAVPGLLQTAVADLARARLYPRGAPEGVTNAAAAQRRILDRIAAGAIPLPGVGGTAPIASMGDDGLVSGWTGDGQFRATLEDY